MALSIELSFVLFEIFYCVHFGFFSSLKGNTLFYKKAKEIFHTFQGTQNHKEDVTIMMYAMYAATSVAGTCMTCRSSHEEVDVAWQCNSERLWNALIGRNGGYFEERYKEAYDDRAYHAKGLDVAAKVDTNSRSEKKAKHGTGEASKIWKGGSVNFQYLH